MSSQPPPTTVDPGEGGPDDPRRPRYAAPPTYDPTPSSRHAAPGTWVDPHPGAARPAPGWIPSQPSGRGPAPGTFVDPRPSGPRTAPGTFLDPQPPGRRPAPGTFVDPQPSGRRPAPGTFVDPHPSGRHGAPPTRADPIPGTHRPAPGTFLDAPSGPPRAPGAEPPDPDGSESLSRLPKPLREHYTVIRDLSTAGAEADLVLVRELFSPGGLRVAKLYRQPTRHEDDDLRSRLQGGERAHVVHVVQAGDHLGRRWEIQEYVELGSLDDLVAREGRPLGSDLVRSILVELTDALEHFHSLGAVHRDIKPGNILVRSRHDPFDLVLADFGLAVSASQHQRSFSRTSAYAAPEAAVGGSTAARDWWSLGISVLELLIGRHPFQDDSGRWFEEHQINNEIATRPIPLDGVDDDRWRLLLRGLLTRDPLMRWGSNEVREWLAGGSPEVADDPIATGTAAGRARPFSVDGHTMNVPLDLAEHLNQHWDTSAGSMVNTRIDELADWVAQFNAPELAATVDNFPTWRLHVDKLMARLIIQLGPPERPAFRKMPMHPALLANTARVAAQGGDGSAKATKSLADLRASNALPEYEFLGGDYKGLSTAGERWSRWSNELDALVARARIPVDFRKEVTAGAGAALLLCALDEDVARQALAATPTRSAAFPTYSWWGALSGDAAASPEVIGCVLDAAHHIVEGLVREDQVRRERKARDERTARDVAAAGRLARRDRMPILVACIAVATLVLPWLLGQFLWRPYLAAVSVPSPPDPAAVSTAANFVPDGVFGALLLLGLLGLWLVRPPWPRLRRRRTYIGAFLVLLGMLSAPIANSTADAFLTAGNETYATGPVTAEAIGSVCGSVLTEEGADGVYRSYALRKGSPDIANGCTSLTGYTAFRSTWTTQAAASGAFVSLSRYGDVLVARQSVEAAPNTLVGVDATTGKVRWRWSCGDKNVQYLTNEVYAPQYVQVQCKSGARFITPATGKAYSG